MNEVIPPVPTEEDEEWEILSREIKRKEKQMSEAFASAQEFIEGLAPAEIGIFTLRKAFQEGFMSGASWAKNTKGK